MDSCHARARAAGGGAFSRFGAPLAAFGITAADFEHLGAVYRMGLPPLRIDVITQLSGIAFEEAWPHRVTSPLRGVQVSFLGKAALLENKRAAGRPKDLLDVEILERES